MKFKKFKIYFRLVYPSKPLPNDDFLYWFIGFMEGDGSFTITKRGDLQWVVTQSIQDNQILEYIKSEFGFGNIYIQSQKQKTKRYIIQDLTNLYLMCLLFNGNMYFPVRQAKFHLFVTKLNEKIIRNKLGNNWPLIKPNFELKKVSLQDYWLCGITDAEGCFSISFLKNSKHAFRIRFILSQKWDANKNVLYDILKLFELKNNGRPVGSVVKHSNPIANVFELRINGLKNQNQILEYFDKFPLKTKKEKAYLIYKDILKEIIQGVHLTLEGREKLKKRAKTINNS